MIDKGKRRVEQMNDFGLEQPVSAQSLKWSANRPKQGFQTQTVTLED
jgi:hypothetical protein